MNILKAMLAEFIGTAVLVGVVIGSGPLARLLGFHNEAVIHLITSGALVAAMYLLYTRLEPFSGGHLNPLITLLTAFSSRMSPHERAPLTALYLLAQGSGAIAGGWLGLAIGGSEPFLQDLALESGSSAWLRELVAAAGLMLVVLLAPTGRRALLLAMYTGAAYWFAASTSLANPAVVLGRMSATLVGDASVEGVFQQVAAQCVGAALGVVAGLLMRPERVER